MSEQYELTSILDIYEKVPTDRIQECCRELGMILAQTKAPAELYQAQGFPADYIHNRDITGRAFTTKAQVARCGNSVSPKMAEALVRANLVDVAHQVAA